jgi:hypothetical protein
MTAVLFVQRVEAAVAGMMAMMMVIKILIQWHVHLEPFIKRPYIDLNPLWGRDSAVSGKIGL